jgi:hypothetical protein
MINPRDPVPQFNVPVNSETGRPLSDRQLHHLGEITEAAKPLYDAMHAAEGSTPPGEHAEHTWSSRRMSIAATHLEIALMMARKAALE